MGALMMDRLYIAAMIALVCCGMAGLLWMSKAMAEPVPAYEGCTLAWDYPPEQAALVQSFGVHIDAREKSIPVAGTARSIKCAELGLVLGQEHLIKVRAWNKDLGHSPFAEIRVKYQVKPTMPAPTNIRITLEWAP